MKKILLSGFVILAFVGYIIHKFLEPIPKVAIANPTSIPIQDSSTPVSSPTATSFKDGSYIGDVTDAFYGNVQVQALIHGGKITDVQFLQYPNDRHTSIEINTQAMPLLRQEAIKIQNANVDIVSGATQTSLAFIKSLQSALNQAQ